MTYGKGFHYKDPKDATIAALRNKYKQSARTRGYSFLLSKKYFKFLIYSDCHYCGVEPSNNYTPYLNKDLSLSNYAISCNLDPKRAKDSLIYFNGIDRINSTKGYKKDNVVPCCKICNQAKMDLTPKEFLTWLDRLVKFRSNI